MVVRPGTAPPSSLGSKTDDEDDIDNQRSTKRIRTSLTQSPERQRGQLTKRGKKKKGRPYHVGRRRAATEVRSDEGEDEEVDSSDGELPEDYQDLAKMKVSQLSEANKLAKNKLAVRGSYSLFQNGLLLISSTVTRGCNVQKTLWGQEG